MKIALIITRVLLGLLLTFSSVTYFFNLIPQPELEGPLGTFTEGLAASGYVMPVVKGIELLCGLAFLSGFFVPLATVLIFPVSLNILLVHLLLAPEGIPVAVFVMLSNLFLAYGCRWHYRLLFSTKIKLPEREAQISPSPVA
jgi:putative oxidoreductase